MERDQFVAVETEAWWLIAPEVDYRLEDLRRRLGASFDWADPRWFGERIKLEEVYNFLVAQPRELLDALDQATDEERRVRWLESVIELKKPAVVSVPAAAPPTRWSASSPSAVAARRQTTSAQPRRSAFGSRAQAGPATTGDAGQPAPSTTSVPPRRSAFGSADAAPPAQSPPDVPLRRAFGSRVQGGASADAGNASLAAPTAHKSAVYDQGGKLDDQIQTVISKLSTNELSSMARELGVSLEEVRAIMHESDFAGLVANEQAQIQPVGA